MDNSSFSNIKKEIQSPKDREIKKDNKEESAIKSNYRIPKLKKEIKEEHRETKANPEQDYRYLGSLSVVHSRYSPQQRGESPSKYRHVSPRRRYRDDSPRSNCYQSPRRSRTPPRMSRQQVKRELGITVEKLEEMERDGFWEWMAGDEERECPVCKVSVTGADPWYAHLEGNFNTLCFYPV